MQFKHSFWIESKIRVPSGKGFLKGFMMVKPLEVDKKVISWYPPTSDLEPQTNSFGFWTLNFRLNIAMLRVSWREFLGWTWLLENSRVLSPIMWETHGNHVCLPKGRHTLWQIHISRNVVRGLQHWVAIFCKFSSLRTPNCSHFFSQHLQF
jgi:hypothetical protein